MHGYWVVPITFKIRPGLPITLGGPTDAMSFPRGKWIWPITDASIHAMAVCEASMDRETDTAEPSYAPVRQALLTAGMKAC